MNYRMILRTLGYILLFETVFLCVPLLTALVYEEREIISFGLTILICGGIGGLCLLIQPKTFSIYTKEGVVIVALSWIILSLFGAIPFYFSGCVSTYVDAFFEIVSGFTTTGSSIIPNVEILPKSILIWRSFSHWIGGMGVLVFIMAFLPMSGASNLHLMKAESPGPDVSKLVPKIKHTAVILYLIYTSLTIVMIVFLLFGEMDFFQALNTALSTAGTGGFGFKADSMRQFSSYTQIVITVFMLLFSLNFTSYYLVLRARFKEALTTEIKVFLGIVVGAIALLTLNLCLSNIPLPDGANTFWGALKHSAFSVISIMSTTGFVSTDFNLWPNFARAILVVLTFVGACAGSTGGGLKISRITVLCKGAGNEVRRMLHPKQVRRITIDGKTVDHEVVRSINAYLVAYVLIFIVSCLIISLEGLDLVTTFTSVATTFNNVGPGLEVVGPMGSFAGFSWWGKLVFSLDMLFGRLEIFPMLMLFVPATWKKA